MKYPTYVDFAITPFCNLNCNFCYVGINNNIKSLNKILTLEEFEMIFSQFDDLGVMRVGFEGGEPFLRNDWYDIFKLADKHYFNYYVNTNATLIDEKNADLIKDTNIDKVCVSLDGSNSLIHDLSRGKQGAFDLTIKGIRNLVSRDILVDGVITLSKYNKDNLINIFNLMIDLGINNIVIMLLSVVGNAKRFKQDCYLLYEELKEVIIELTDLKKKNALPISLSIVPVGEGTVPWEIYLPLKDENRLDDLFLWIPEDQYDTLEISSFGCTAGKDNFYVDAYGDVYGCSMMCSMKELSAGNLRNNLLSDIWNNSSMFKKIRNLEINNLTGKCKNCTYFSICKGGCRACAYASTNSLDGSDNRCPL